MENQLSFVCMLSLKEIALRRVAVILWNEPDIFASIESLYSGRPTDCGVYSDAWRRTVESKVTDKITKLALPESLTKQILLIVTPIGLQIQTWKWFLEEKLKLEKFCVPILLKLCWTTAGTIDYRKTAKELIRCEMVDVVRRYRLACLYCLEDCIPFLWEKLPEESKKQFYNEEDTSPIFKVKPDVCWPYILKGEQSKLDCRFKSISSSYGLSFNQYAFKDSVVSKNKAAAEYFFQKLTQEEKEVCLILTSERRAALLPNSVAYNHPLIYLSPHSVDVVCYLLSKLNHEQLTEVLSSKFCVNEVLRCMLDWPWQDFFLKIADLAWPLLGAVEYNFLLRHIFRYFTRTRYYFPKLFQEFFAHSPIGFRKAFVDKECREHEFFPLIFQLQDSETIEVIFRNVDAADRVKLLTSHIFLFYRFILTDRCHMLKVCLREAALSWDDCMDLKETFMEFKFRGNVNRDAPMSRTFQQLLDEAYMSGGNKRRLENETLNETKKLCSECIHDV